MKEKPYQNTKAEIPMPYSDLCIDYIKKTESILRNGYYHDHGAFYLLTYNSGGKEGLDVKQTINMNLTRSLSELMDVPEYFIMGTILTHYQEARRFDTIDVLKELEGKKIIIADRDLVVCSNIDPEIFSSIKEWANGGEEKKLDMKKPSCHDFIKGSESILTNGYYSDMGLFYLITYNSEMGKFTNVFQTVDHLIVDKLAFFLGFSDISIGAMLLKHYEEARRFDSLNILKEIKDKPVIIVDRDTIVCSSYNRKKAKLKEGGEVNKKSSNFTDYGTSRKESRTEVSNGGSQSSVRKSDGVHSKIENARIYIRRCVGSTKKEQSLIDGHLESTCALRYAKESNIWIPDVSVIGRPISGGGIENTLYLDDKSAVIYKSNNLYNYKFSISLFLEGIQAYNEIFLTNRYELIGFTGFENNGINPYVEPVIKQDYIFNSEKATQSEIDSYMLSLGFSKINDHSFSNNKYTVSDLHPRNVLKDPDGTIHVIDAIVRINTKEKFDIGGEVSNESNEGINEYYQDLIKRNLPVDLADYKLKKYLKDNNATTNDGLVKSYITSETEYQKLNSEYKSEFKKMQDANRAASDKFKKLSHIDRQKGLKMYKEYFEKYLAEEIKEDQLSKGTKVELEHKDTIEEIASGKLSPEEGAKEIAKDHIDEDPQYYDKLEKVESKTPIKELGTGSKVYFETPFYRVNEYSGGNLNDRFIFTMKAKDDQYGVPLFEHFFDDIDIALFVAEKISKIYPNGVPEAALIHRIIKDISGEYKEKQENNMNSTNNELTGVKSIIVNESIPFSNWNEANESTKWLISQQVWSNLPYKIEFQDGFILEGTIDAEPYSFWKDKKNPLTWHLNTFWGNLARATANPIYDQESIDYAKKVVTKYNIGQDISTDVDNSDVTPPESEDAEVVSSAKQDVIKKLLKEKKTAYNFVYDRLLKVAPDLLRLLNEAEYTSDVYGKSQYRTHDFGGNDAFMYLAIEGLDKDEQGRYELSISHYYKQHGDMMCDPCMTVRLDPELKTVEALTFKMDGVIGRGIIKSVYGTTKDGKPGVNLYEKKDQNSFLNKWSSNWVKQGHKVEFRPLPEKEVSGTPISAEAQAVTQPEWDKMQDFLAGKETKASDRKDENEIKREKYPVVVQFSEGSSDENIGFENLEQLEIWLDQIGFTENPDETYIKNKVWFRGMTSYVRIDLSKQKGDFNPKEQSLIEYLIENVSNEFDWQSLSESKKPIVQDANFTYFKGIEANYDNQFKLNKAIEEFLDSKTDDYVYATEEKEFISTYEGYGGLEKQGATGVGLLFEYYTPPKLIEKMWGLAYKYGFSTGKVLEPSVGIGRFLNYTSKNDIVKGYEISPYSAKICRIIHPKANIIQSSFAEHFYKGNVFNPKFEKDFDLVIGNPPYGKMTDIRTYGENSRIGVSISQYEHYFILRGLDCLKSGGLLIYVSTANLATKGYEKIKEKIIEKSDLVDCYLLPNTTFKQTKVNTSLIVLRRK